MKDKRACIFYFLMTIILFDFGSQLRRLSFSPFFANINNPIFAISHVNNTGSAFGMFLGGTSYLAILGIITLILIAIYVFKRVHFSEKSTLLALTFFSGGVLGNVVERLDFKTVVDYIKLNFINFPVFNAFDCMICLGVTIYFISLLVELKKNKKDGNDCKN